MNYIEEELRRQATAFAALLGSGTDWECNAAEKTTEDRKGTQAADGGDGVLRACPAAQMLNRDTTEKMAEWNQLLRRRSAQSFRQAANAMGLTKTEMEATLTEENQVERTDPERVEAWQMGRAENPNTTGRAEAGGSAETIRQVRKNTRDSGAGMNFENSGETVFVVDRGVSAGELSRIFQRDARRYDGGYPLY